MEFTQNGLQRQEVRPRLAQFSTCCTNHIGFWLTSLSRPPSDINNAYHAPGHARKVRNLAAKLNFGRKSGKTSPYPVPDIRIASDFIRECTAVHDYLIEDGRSHLPPEGRSLGNA